MPILGKLALGVMWGWKTSQVHKTLWKWTMLVCLASLPTRAQETEFLPEVDAHVTLNSTFRTYLEVKDDRDGGEPTQLAVGPSLQIYLKPLIKLKKVTEFDLDDSKSRFLVVETGYRYITAPGAPPENRLVEAATSNFPLNAGFSSGTGTGSIWTGKMAASPGGIGTD
jgi:hypothetical protein